MLFTMPRTFSFPFAYSRSFFQTFIPVFFPPTDTLFIFLIINGHVFFLSKNISVLELELIHNKFSLIGSPLPLLLPPGLGLPPASSTSQSLGLTQESLLLFSSQTSTPPVSMPPATIPFTTLNPNHKKWSIQGRVVAKTNIHEYTNRKGPWKLFGFDLLDCSGEEIHVSAFNNFVDSFYSQIERGTVYTVSNGTIKATNPAYNHLNNHIDIILSYTSNIQPFLHAFPLILVHSFYIKTINDLQSSSLNSMVIYISPASTNREKYGSENNRRNFSLRDTSFFSIDVTLCVHHCHIEGSELASL